MKYKREYCFSGFNGKKNEDDFVVGYQAENGQYIDCIYSISSNTPIGYTVYRSRERCMNERGDYVRAFDKLREAKMFLETEKL